jgi:flagellar biosynthesis protein FlhA
VKGLGKLAVPIGVVAIVLMLVVPLPAAVLDLLLGLNITASLLILLVSMQIRKPLDFAVFPSLILIATLFRLSLNVSSTRLVLTDGYAGKVIEAFGHFVIGGSLVVGLVIFVILTIIQFVVITNGAGRVAEVGARFTLDAMPGKQMAIDADLNAGLINETQARRRRHEVTAEADFYGSMDGASKFVKGDAIAAIIITLINLIGGFAIGVMQRGMAPADAVSTFSLLTVGDGLVSQIPALLLSTATGIIVTRSATEGDMGTDLIGQLGRFKQPVRIAGGAAIALCLIPGLPKLPFLVIGAGFLIMASRMSETPAVDDETEAAAAAADNEPKPDSPEAIAEKMRVDPLELEVAFDLVDLVDPARGGDLLDRVKALRRKVAMDTGLVIPLVRTRDNLDLPGSQYVDLAQRRPGGQGHLAGRHDPRDRRQPRGHPREGDPRAGVRPGRQVGSRRAAASGGDGRRHRRRPLVGHHHAPRGGRPAERGGPARPGGCPAPGGDGAPHASRRRRGTDPHAAHPGRGATRVARVAR